MENHLSRSEKKRQAKAVEHLAYELAALADTAIKALPCEKYLISEIMQAKALKGGARKRQIKYIAKELRAQDTKPLLRFLEDKKGSQLRKNQEFRNLERLREDVISEAIKHYADAEEAETGVDEKWQSPFLENIKEMFPVLDMQALRSSALRYAATRKPLYKREIFRMLKAASERKHFEGEQ